MATRTRFQARDLPAFGQVYSVCYCPLFRTFCSHEHVLTKSLPLLCREQVYGASCRCLCGPCRR